MYQHKHKDEGLEVLGFPCDQFGHQEPGDEREIKNFCSLTLPGELPDVRQGQRQWRQRASAVEMA